eukprot:8094916-Alexandrium_andersonii.AAC.1
MYWVGRFKCSLPKRPCRPIHRNMLPGELVHMATAALPAPPLSTGGGAGSAMPVAGPGAGTVVEGCVVYDLGPDYHAPQPTDGGAA